MKVMSTGACVPLTTEYGIPMFEPWYCPDPKSACIPTLDPMKLMMAVRVRIHRRAGNILVPEAIAAEGTKPIEAGALSRAHRAAGALVVAPTAGPATAA